MNRSRCKCGRSKYEDADLCDKCWQEESRYDERRSGDRNYCRCGKGKYPDADLCSDCWDAESAYDDGR